MINVQTILYLRNIWSFNYLRLSSVGEHCGSVIQPNFNNFNIWQEERGQVRKRSKSKENQHLKETLTLHERFFRTVWSLLHHHGCNLVMNFEVYGPDWPMIQNFLLLMNKRLRFQIQIAIQIHHPKNNNAVTCYVFIHYVHCLYQPRGDSLLL